MNHCSRCSVTLQPEVGSAVTRRPPPGPKDPRTDRPDQDAGAHSEQASATGGAEVVEVRAKGPGAARAGGPSPRRAASRPRGRPARGRAAPSRVRGPAPRVSGRPSATLYPGAPATAAAPVPRLWGPRPAEAPPQEEAVGRPLYGREEEVVREDPLRAPAPVDPPPQGGAPPSHRAPRGARPRRDGSKDPTAVKPP